VTISVEEAVTVTGGRGSLEKVVTTVEDCAHELFVLPNVVVLAADTPARRVF